MMEKDKDKADTKRLARCGKCVNCKSQVRAGWMSAASSKRPENLAEADADLTWAAGPCRRSAWPEAGGSVHQRFSRSQPKRTPSLFLDFAVFISLQQHQYHQTHDRVNHRPRVNVSQSVNPPPVCISRANARRVSERTTATLARGHQSRSRIKRLVPLGSLAGPGGAGAS